MKKLLYQIEGYTSVYNLDTKEVEQCQTLSMVTVENPSAEDIAKAVENAYSGKYTIVDDGQNNPIAPRNITEGEYITVDGVMYKATSNIPNGSYIITGQNAVATTIEEQLYEMMKGE